MTESSTRRSRHLRRDTFVPTSIWAAVFSPSLPVVAWITATLTGHVLDVAESDRQLMSSVVIVGAVAVSGAYYLYRSRRNRRTPETDAALTALAESRGMRLVPLGSVPDHLKQALGIVGRGTTRDTLVSVGEPDVRIGTVERSSASDGGYVQDWGFLSIRLGTELPNILLESRTGRSLLGSDNPLAAPRSDQALSLEGDFDRHFRLLCPAGYERDALYIFTPDLMALLIDEAHDFSVQFIDDVAVFSSPQPFDLSDEKLAERLFRIVDIVGAKALSRTRRYSDARSAVDGSVAEPGRRLDRRIPGPATLTLWYSLNALLGVAIAAAVMIAVLGPDPSAWPGERSLL